MIIVEIDHPADIMTDLIIIMIVAIMAFDEAQATTTQGNAINIHRIARVIIMNHVPQETIFVHRMSVVGE